MGRVAAGTGLFLLFFYLLGTGARSVESPTGEEAGQSIFTEGVNPWTTVQFLRLVGKGGHGKQGYSLVLSVTAPRRWPFGRGNAEFRVDRTSYPAPVIAVEQRMTGMYTILTLCAIYVEPLLGEKLRKAERVELGIPLETGRPQLWEVPGFVLTGWKKVIEGEGR